MIWIILAIILCYFIYVALIKPVNYWKDRNVPYNKAWPLLGSTFPVFTRGKAFFYMMIDFYNEFPNERFSGIFHFQNPILCIRDPDLIKQIMVKDFGYFVHRAIPMTEDTDPVMCKSLINLHGEKWRNMRAILSPSFTGSKLKFLFNLISDCAIQFTKHFESLDSEVIEVEMKNASSRFTNDVIATCAFGITTDSLNQKDNEFFQKGKEVTGFAGFRIVAVILYVLLPPLKRILRVSLVSPKLVKFFQNIVNETIESREKYGTIRPDMIHLLLESKKEANISTTEKCKDPLDGAVQNAKITNDDITAQEILFFSSGFDVVSSLASFMSYELALNKDVQEKLQAEIDEVAETCNGKPTYEQIIGMKYLDMVASEALRKWPPTIVVDRICSQDYVIEGKTENEKSIVVQKGVAIFLPIIAIHRNPEYFPNPEQFDPERFSDENKHKIVPFSYMPFGVGPKSCVASRFALLETKILFFHLLSKFNIITTEKTPIPLIISKRKFTVEPDEGFCLAFQRRN